MNNPIADYGKHQRKQHQQNPVNLLLLIKFSIFTRKAHLVHISTFKVLKERFYEAKILISELEPIGSNAL